MAVNEQTESHLVGSLFAFGYPKCSICANSDVRQGPFRVSIGFLIRSAIPGFVLMSVIWFLWLLALSALAGLGPLSGLGALLPSMSTVREWAAQDQVVLMTLGALGTIVVGVTAGTYIRERRRRQVVTLLERDVDLCTRPRDLRLLEVYASLTIEVRLFMGGLGRFVGVALGLLIVAGPSPVAVAVLAIAVVMAPIAVLNRARRIEKASELSARGSLQDLAPGGNFDAALAVERWRQIEHHARRGRVVQGFAAATLALWVMILLLMVHRGIGPLSLLTEAVPSVKVALTAATVVLVQAAAATIRRGTDIVRLGQTHSLLHGRAAALGIDDFDDE